MPALPHGSVERTFLFSACHVLQVVLCVTKIKALRKGGKARARKERRKEKKKGEEEKERGWKQREAKGRKGKQTEQKGSKGKKREAKEAWEAKERNGAHREAKGRKGLLTPACQLHLPEQQTVHALRGIDLIAVDELQQLGAEDFERILRQWRHAGCSPALVFLGDKYQLPGVTPPRPGSGASRALQS